MSLMATAYRPDQLLDLRDPAVLFVGRSNVGKSSLLNSICGQDLAHVSKSPGKTRSVNYYQYGDKLVLIDLPGFGYAKRSKGEREKWGRLMKELFDGIPGSSRVYLLVDSKRGLEEEENLLLDSLLERSYEVEVLLTKSDRLNQSDRQRRQISMENTLNNYHAENLLTWRWVSVKSGEGIEAVRRDLFYYGKEVKL